MATPGRHNRGGCASSVVTTVVGEGVWKAVVLKTEKYFGRCAHGGDLGVSRPSQAWTPAGRLGPAIRRLLTATRGYCARGHKGGARETDRGGTGAR
jgi:hypothetical protein